MEGKQEAGGAGGYRGPDKGGWPAFGWSRSEQPEHYDESSQNSKQAQQNVPEGQDCHAEDHECSFREEIPQCSDEGPLTYTRRTQRANRRAERVSRDHSG